MRKSTKTLVGIWIFAALSILVMFISGGEKPWFYIGMIGFFTAFAFWIPFASIRISEILNRKTDDEK